MRGKLTLTSQQNPDISNQRRESAIKSFHNRAIQFQLAIEINNLPEVDYMNYVQTKSVDKLIEYYLRLCVVDISLMDHVFAHCLSSW